MTHNELAGEQPHEDDASPRRRWLVFTGSVILAALLAGGGTAFALGYGGTEAAPAASKSSAPLSTARVVKTDLSVSSNFDGVLDYGPPRELKGQGAGIITWLPALGTVLDRSVTAYRVDDRPIPVMIGATPLYRPLDDSANMRGADVTMVAQNLMALKFMPESDPTKMVTGPRFRAAVRAWQKSVGQEITGVLTPGDVVVLPTVARVSQLTAQLADSAASNLFMITDAQKHITLTVDPSKAASLLAGVAATVVLPNGTTTPAKVMSVGTVVSTSDANSVASAPPKLSVAIAVDDPASVTALDYAPVTVRIVTTTHAGVFVVPVAALVALREGGYAVQTPKGKLLAVKTGLFSDDRVEISGPAIQAGLTVVTAK